MQFFFSGATLLVLWCHIVPLTLAGQDGTPPPEDCRCVTSVPFLGYCRADGTCYCRLDSNGMCECNWPGDGPLLWWDCASGSGCCGPNTRHRDLSSSFLLRLHRGGDGNDDKLAEEEYQSILETCGSFEYQTSLHVDSHLRAIATPSKQAQEAGCPFAVVQTIFTDATQPGVKELSIWYDQEAGETKFKPEHSLSIGTFSLAKLAQAYEKADPNSSNSKGSGGYDIVTNNCGSFMVNLALELGVQVDMTKVSAFVARRLVEESGKQLVAGIRNRMSTLQEFLKQGKQNDNKERQLLRQGAVADSELVELLVEAHTSKLY